MTVPTALARVAYVGDGVTLAFTIPYKFLANADVAVYLDGVLQATGVTVTGAGSAAGTATFAAAPAALASVVIVRAQINDQQTVVAPNGPFPARTVEAMADKAMIGVQQANDTAQLAIRISPGEATTLNALPLAAVRAGNLLGFNAVTGQPEVAPFTMTQVASAIAAAYAGAAGPLDALSFIQAGTGAVSRTAQAKAREWISVPDFTTPAAAVAASYAAGGGQLRIPAATHALTAGITHTGDVDLVLQGSGYTASKLTTNIAGVIPLTIGQTGADNANVNIALRDFGITGAAGTGVGLKLQRLHNVVSHNLRIRNNGGDGVYADRCYGQTYYSLYANNNVAAGFHAPPAVGTNGNDNTILINGRFLANGTKGIHIEGSAPGLMLLGNDVEGNATGVQIDAGTVLQSEAVTLMGNYFENQIGKNISIGEDGGATLYIWGLTMQGNVINPGTVGAAANAVSINRVKGAVIANNHFSTADLVVGADVSQLIIGPNKHSGSTGPWGAAGTEPMRYFMSTVGADFVHGWRPIGWSTRHRVGVPLQGDQMVMSMNLLPTAAAAGTQDDATVGSSLWTLGANAGSLQRCAAGGGAALSTVFSWDSTGLSLKSAKVDVIATASLPAAGATQDGRVVIEDPGVGSCNLVAYKGGQRFRIALGAPF